MRTTILALLVLVLFAASADAALIHRYSFTADATDSIGSAHGMLVGDAHVSGGEVVLDGAGDYVDLLSDGADGININNYTSGTFEAWFTFDASNGVWQRVFDLGNDGGNSDYVFYSPAGNPFGQPHQAMAITDGGGGAEQYVWVPGHLSSGTYHVAVVVDAVNGELRYYLNGGLVDTNSALTHDLSVVSNAEAYLGKAMYPDPLLKGSIDEFRIYSAALDDGDVLASYNAGPDQIVPEPVTLALLAAGGLALIRRRRA